MLTKLEKCDIYVNMHEASSKRATFGQMLRNRRIVRGYSLRKLSTMLDGDVSHEMLSRYEKDAAEPRPEVKEKLCKLLEIDEGYGICGLTQLPELKFRRSRWNIPQKEIEAAKLLALEHCNHYLALENALGDSIEWKNPFTQSEQKKLLRRIKNEQDRPSAIEDIVDELRKRWNLGGGAIPSISTLLEQKGILVCEIPFNNNRLDGFSFFFEGKPFICIADWLNRNPARKRMTLSHELGHILFPDMDADEASDKEYCIMRFAGAFLIPRTAVLDALGASQRKELPLYELLELKHYYGISIVGLMARAMQLNIIDWEQYCSYNGRFYRQFHAHTPEEQQQDLEPGLPYLVPDVSLRPAFLANRILSTGKLNLSNNVQITDSKRIEDITLDLLK